MLFDTTFLIDLMRNNSDAVEKARELESNFVQQRIAAMTLFELYHGVARSNRPKDEREAVERVLTSKAVQSADAKVMKRAGKISGRLASEGDHVGDGDAIIGARPHS